ncbi:MAG: thymidine phosphorylase [Pirellulaceae bacterium]
MHTNPALIIAHKRDGLELSAQEIESFVTGFASGAIADYQMAAMAMAIYCRGMTENETACLTECMLNSGTTLIWPPDNTVRVDKHSTGGIGDKVSLVLAPLLACCGCQVPMLSGRGLGITGGTLDKLESIPGFRTDLDLAELQRVTDSVGCVITGASEELAPADKKLYALRDVTSTIASIPLITASIMSKKLAENLDSLVLDVKCGNGTFMKTIDQGRSLAESLVTTGQRMGLNTSAFLTDMNQPVGRMIGNALEVQEAMDLLQGEGPEDLKQLALTFATELLITSGAVANQEAAKATLSEHLDTGRAYEKSLEMIRAQGGDPEADRPLAAASDLQVPHGGYVATINSEQLGQAIIELGGGRRTMNASIDRGVGLEMHVRVGDLVEPDQLLARVFSREPEREAVSRMVVEAITIEPEPVLPNELILAHIPCSPER